MAPFIDRPEGFSEETLDLLDKAMTRLWLEQVAIGASMSGCNAAPDEKLPQIAERRPSRHTRRIRT